MDLLYLCIGHAVRGSSHLTRERGRGGWTRGNHKANDFYQCTASDRHATEFQWNVNCDTGFLFHGCLTRTGGHTRLSQ